MLPTGGGQLQKRGSISVHGENRFGAHQLSARRDAAKQPLQSPDIPMRVDDRSGARQAAAVRERGVIALIGNDRVFRSAQGRKNSNVRRVPAVEEQPGFRMSKDRQPPLELVMRDTASNQQPGSTGADAAQAQRFGRRPFHPLVVAQ